MIGVLDLKSGTHRHLLPGVAARYAPNGYLLVVDANGGLSAAPFDQDRLSVTGELVTLAKDVHMDGWQVNLAKAGAGFAYAIGNQARDSVELVWAGENGRITPAAPGWTDAIDEAALSPDGSRVALSIRSGGRRDVWIRRLDNGALNRLTFTGGFTPRWSRDSRTVYYTRVPPDHGMDLAARPADGSSDEVVVARGDVYVGRATAAPDGSHLVFWNYDNTSRGDLMTVEPGKDTVPQPLRVTASDDEEPALSPDGRWLAYSSDENGIIQVYVRPYPNVGETVWQASSEGARSPAWSRNGRELYYVDADNRIVGVEIVPGPTFAMGRRRTVLSLGAISVSLNAGAQAADGRFLAMRRVSAAPDLQIVVVQNFLAELRSRVRKQ